MEARVWFLYGMLSLAALASLAPAASALDLDLAESDVGLDFLHAGRLDVNATYPETMGSGACVLDFDGDGWEDLLLVNGLYSDPAAQAAMDPHSALFRNLNGSGFARVAGVLEVRAWGMGCAAADMDGDEDPDVAIHTWGGLQLFRNDGASFTNVSASLPEADCGVEVCFGSSVAFFDADGDLDLDLYATNYLEWDQVGVPTPMLYEGQCNTLYRNLGAGLWEDATAATGTADCGQNHLGLAIADFTGDGRQDVFIASDETPDTLLVALANGTFVDRAEEWNVNDYRGGMGTAAGYFDDDALLDLVITHYETEGFALYRQNASGGFDDAARTSGFHNASLPYVGWGIEWVDLDHDGDQDLIMVNGFVPGDIFHNRSYEQRALVMDNDGAGGLVDVTSRWTPLDASGVSRGFAMADFDQDGAMDFVVVDNSNETVRFVRASGGPGNWLEIDPEGDALGAIVEVDVGGRTQRREIVAASSYQSQSTRVAHFGLGNATSVDALRVRFPGGETLALGPVEVNQRLLVDEAGGISVQRASPLVSLPARFEALRHEVVRIAGTTLRAPPGSVEAFVVDGEVVPGATLSRAWTTVGEREVRYRVVAPDGREDVAVARVVVRNAPPTAAALVPATADRVTATLLDASASADVDGAVVAWSWSVEGATYEGATVAHTFEALGPVPVTLTVTDDDGASATRTYSVLVQNLAPVARAGPDRPSNVVAHLPFSAAQSADPDGAIVSWTWDFGDGASATGADVTHRYEALGEFVATLTVTDNEGATATDALAVRVLDENLPPEPRIAAPALADRVVAARFDASGSVDLDNAIVRHAWDFGDGSTAEGAIVEHRYAALGAFDVTLTLEDTFGATSIATARVEVVNLAPLVEPLGLRAREGFGALSIEAPAVDLDGTIAAYRWTLDGVLVGEARTLALDLQRFGRIPLALEATDDAGATRAAAGEVWAFARPVARFEAPARGDRVTAIALDGAASDDADGQVTAWSWRSPDGSRASGPRADWTPSVLGENLVTLEVVDDDGLAGSLTRTILVENLLPRIELAPHATIANLGRPVRLSAAASDPDGPPPIVRWTVDGKDAGEGNEIEIRFSQLGTFAIEAIAVDADGGEARSSSAIDTTDELDARVSTTKRTYGIEEPVEGSVVVRFADGSAAAESSLRLRIVYRTRDEVGLPASLVVRELRASTDANGSYKFRLEDVWPEVARPFLPRLRPPTDACASYEIRLDASWLENAGADVARFHVNVHSAADTVCEMIAPVRAVGQETDPRREEHTYAGGTLSPTGETSRGPHTLLFSDG